MSEAAIFVVHFGDESDNGRGGDYRTWLDERRHTRADHKYAPGKPVRIDAEKFDRALVNGGKYLSVEEDTKIDLEIALSRLTMLERKYFIEVHYEGLTNSFIAMRDNKDESAVRRTVNRAKEKIKNNFK